MPLVRLVYYSSVAGNLSKIDIKKILYSCQTNNRLLGLSGVLCFNQLHFIQVLEGRRYDVNKMFLRILADKRHVHPVLASLVDIEKREFGDWLMAYIGHDSMTTATLEKYQCQGKLDLAAMRGDEIYGMIMELFGMATAGRSVGGQDGEPVGVPAASADFGSS